MASKEKTSQPFISTKRQLDDADDRELDEFRKPKTAVRKYPPPKIRIGVGFVRDFPPDCGILRDSIETKTDMNHSKKSDIEKSDKPKELGFNNRSISKSPPKVKHFDPKNQKVHAFPPVSRLTQERKPLKPLHNVESKLGFTKPSSVKRQVKFWDPRSNDDNTPAPEPKPVTTGKVKFWDPRSNDDNTPAPAPKPVTTGKVKFWDPRSNDDNTPAPEPKPVTTVVSQKEQIRRKKIREAMILFDKVYNQLFEENKSKQGRKLAPCKVPTEASRIVQQKLKMMNADKALGEIRGVQPGDKFRFRSQLQLVGIHCQPLCGIDYTNINGRNVALSIVDSHRYSNESQTSEVLTYCGEGGHGVSMWGNRNVQPDDQKLERGNLALKNSMLDKTPVRVIRKIFGVYKKSNDLFVYDGLYTVENCTQKRGVEGKKVFMFELRKMAGQRKVNVGDVTMYNHSTFHMV